jgi:hypothetical protein
MFVFVTSLSIARELAGLWTCEATYTDSRNATQTIEIPVNFWGQCILFLILKRIAFCFKIKKNCFAIHATLVMKNISLMSRCVCAWGGVRWG